MRKPTFCIGENKGADRLVQFPKFHASSLFHRMYRSVCVGCGLKSRRPDFVLIFSQIPS